MDSGRITEVAGMGRTILLAEGERLEISRDPLTKAELDKAMASRSGPASTLTTVIGDPRAARESVSRFEAAGVDELILVMDLGTVPHEIVSESLRTFAKKVMPHFA